MGDDGLRAANLFWVFRSLPDLVITLIGTGHIFDLSARLRDEIRKRAPDTVCLELDPRRLQGLLQKDKRGEVPLVYRLLARFQERLARERGVEPGGEMLAALDAAKEISAQVVLIDQDAQVTFQRLWRTMPWGEKARFALSSAAGLILPGKSVEQQVDEVSADYAAFFENMGKEFPTIKRVLIDERNQHMARGLLALEGQGRRVVAVVGDGHVDGVAGILQGNGLIPEVLRLKDLRQQLPTNEAGFSVTVDG